MRHDLNLLLRNDLLSFAKKAFWEMNAQRMPEDRYLELLASRLAEVVTGDSKRLIVNLPPRHFKSWIGSVCLSAWILGHHPSAKILIVTYGQELADKIAHTIRGILRSQWYEELFKKTSLAKSRSKLVDFVSTAGGGVRSVSIEGGVTGHGADYIIIDDPTELKDCDNVKRLDRVVELFDGEILTRLNNPRRGRVVIIAHRVNEDDLPGHLLEQGGVGSFAAAPDCHAPAELQAARRWGLGPGKGRAAAAGRLHPTRHRAAASREAARVRDGPAAKPRRDQAADQAGTLRTIPLHAGSDVRFRCGAQR
jgi:hypothetical protein